MELTVGRFLRLVVTLFFVFVVGWLLYSLSEIITILIIAALIAYILDPLASFLESKGLTRVVATTILFTALFLSLVVSAWLFIPALFNELMSIQANLSLDTANNFIAQIEKILQEKVTFINTDDLNLQEKVNTFFTSFTDQIISFLVDAVSIVSAVVIIPFITFFLLKDGRHMQKSLISYMPNRYFEMSLNVLHKMDQQLGGYLRGQFIEAFVVGILAIIALWILGIKYFILIGIFAGLANLIPYVGPVAGAVPAIMVALANGEGMSTILYIAIAFTLIQLIDNVIMQPLVLSKSVNLHPLIIVFAVLIGGKFFGLLGMFLAVPAAGIIKVTSSEIYRGVQKFNII